MASEREWAEFKTALGTCAVVWTARGLVRVLLPETEAGALAARLARGGRRAEPPPAVAASMAAIAAHVGGVETAYPAVELDETGLAPFERQVYAALRAVGWGSTTTYGGLAAAAGAPGAAREVGVAMARNRWPVVVPCHRVLPAEGRIGGYSGPGGAETKRRLLALEGVVVGGTPELPGLFQ